MRYPSSRSLLIVLAVVGAGSAYGQPVVLMRYESEHYTAVVPVEADVGASGGMATHGVPGRDGAGFLFRVHDPRPVPGEYELAAWVKGGGTEEPTAVALKLGDQRQLSSIPAQALNPDEYREIAGKWTVRQDCTYGVLTVRWPGTVEVWLDRLEFRLVRPIADDELLPADKREAPPVRHRDGEMSVHMVRGLFSDKHHDALRATSGAPALSTSAFTPGGVKGFPSGEELGGVDVVILGDVSARALSVEERFRLAEWVRAGGGLLILGGPYALGSGKYENSFLEPLLPVVPQGRGDIVKLRTPQPLDGSDGPFSDLDWNRAPCFRFHHRVKLKPGAATVLAAGDIPLLVERPHGDGRVAVVCLTTQGIIDGALPWWEWSDWGRFLIRVLTRVAGGA